MLKMFQIQTFTQKSDFFQTTFELKVWIQTFAENSDQSGRPALGPQKVKTATNLGQNKKIGVEENIENKICSATWVDHKIVLSPTLAPKTAH